MFTKNDVLSLHRHFVSVEELQRRCSAPEKFSGHLMVTYLRKAKGKKKQLVRELKEAGVQLSPYGSNTTMCTKLVEGNIYAVRTRRFLKGVHSNRFPYY